MLFKSVSAGTLLALTMCAAGCESTSLKPRGSTMPAIAPAPPAKNVVTAATNPAPVANNTIGTAHVGAVPPEMMEALKQLMAEDYKERQEAVTRLQQMMGKQFQQSMLVQQLMLQIQDNLAEQLRVMTQNPDPEAQARVAGLMEFNSALSRWAIDVIALPREQSDQVMAWGLKEENLPLMARAYSRREEIRIQAAKQLAKMSGPEVDWMLLQMMNDRNREVSLGVADVLFDRPPNKVTTKAIWERATMALNQYRNNNSVTNKNISIRGRMVNIYDESYNARMQDTEVFVDLLIKQKDPQVSELLNNLFTELSGSINNNNDYRWRTLSPSYGGSQGKAISRLCETFKPKQAIPFYIKAIGSNNNDGSETTMGNNERYRYSTRLDFAAMLILTIGEDPEDYGMKKYMNWDGRWMVKGGTTEEDVVIKKLQGWWKEHATDYGETAPKPKAEKVNEPNADAAAAERAARTKALEEAEVAKRVEAQKRAEAAAAAADAEAKKIKAAQEKVIHD